MPYSIFIEGETVDLCVPSAKAIDDGWAEWFNSRETTKFLQQGVFPNTRENQLEFLESTYDKSRFLLLICGKDNALMGVISLSALDFVNGTCQISLVVGVKQNPKVLCQLEAMALVTEHAFQMMRMQRVWAGQAYPGLRKWNQALEVIGYKTDGIIRDGFIKGSTKSDTAQISCLRDDYESIIERRGKLWLGNKIMLAFFMKRLKACSADKIAALIKEIHREVDDDIRSIEEELGVLASK